MVDKPESPPFGLYEALHLAMTGAAIDVYHALQDRQPGTVIAPESNPRLQNAIEGLCLALAEQRSSLARLQHTTGRPPDMPWIPGMIRALRDVGVHETLINRAFMRFLTNYSGNQDVDPETARKQLTRARHKTGQKSG
jgi:hypothetical protein